MIPKLTLYTKCILPERGTQITTKNSSRREATKRTPRYIRTTKGPTHRPPTDQPKPPWRDPVDSGPSSYKIRLLVPPPLKILTTEGHRIIFVDDASSYRSFMESSTFLSDFFKGIPLEHRHILLKALSCWGLSDYFALLPWPTSSFDVLVCTPWQSQSWNVTRQLSRYVFLLEYFYKEAYQHLNLQ